jgi:hypothetical protein
VANVSIISSCAFVLDQMAKNLLSFEMLCIATPVMLPHTPIDCLVTPQNLVSHVNLDEMRERRVAVKRMSKKHSKAL